MTCVVSSSRAITPTLTFAGVTVLESRWGDEQMASLTFGVGVDDISTATGVGVQVHYLDWTGAEIGTGPLWSFTSAGGSTSGTLTPPSGAAGYRLAANVASGHDGTTCDLSFTFTPVCSGGSLGTYCEYGTELTAPTQFLYHLTPELISAILTAAGRPLLAPFFAAWYYSTIDAHALCQNGPPPMPVLTKEDLNTASPDFAWIAPREKLHQALEALAWPFFCQCVPATGADPDPISPPAPLGDDPDGLPPPLTLICNTTDLCSLIANLGIQLAKVSQEVRQTGDMVTLIQRQHVPFAYRPGTLHEALSDSGTFVVQGILGLNVTLSVPSTWGHTDDDPPRSIPKFGSIQIGAGEWLQDEVQLHYLEQLILEVPGSATIVNYSLRPGVTADIRELLREL